MVGTPYWTACAAVFSSIAAGACAMASFSAYRRTKRLTETQLRLELQKAAARMEADLDALADLLTDAKGSREGFAAIAGEEYKDDRLTLAALRAEGRGLVDPDSVRGLKLEELEERLVSVHVLQPRIHRLMEKYRR